MITLGSKTAMIEPKSNKWMRPLARRREHNLTTDSDVTSNFMCEELDLPKDEVSNKEVFLPDNSKLRTSHKTKLTFKQLSDAAREAHILPGLKRSLLSVNKMSEEGYTAIFHPDEEGVSIHKKGTFAITTNNPPVLQGCKSNQEKLWMVSAQQNDQISKEANNVYVNPQMGTSSVLEWGVPRWEFLSLPARIHMGLPRMDTGTVVLAGHWVTHKVPSSPKISWGSSYGNGD
jgi:hypothetical protein